jgi:hypothetical protein
MHQNSVWNEVNKYRGKFHKFHCAIFSCLPSSFLRHFFLRCNYIKTPPY